ncbi:MAG: DUF669 domain-containing protein [bacterium]
MALEGLKAYDDEWDGMETPEKKEYEPIPNGKYQAVIDKAYMDEAKSSGADLLQLELVIIAGKFKKRRLFKKSTLLTRENLRWLKDDLKKIEVAITPISKLDEQLDKFIDVVVEVYVKNKEYQGKDYPNVYFNKKLDIAIPADLASSEGGGAAYEEVPGAGNDDECPF